jgi:hypothetical protein
MRKCGKDSVTTNDIWYIVTGVLAVPALVFLAAIYDFPSSDNPEFTTHKRRRWWRRFRRDRRHAS